jgi:hypothetical protein
MSDLLHIFAREAASRMPTIRNKLVNYNQIVEASFAFYNNPQDGVIECLQSCCPDTANYDGKNTMAASLLANYKWMAIK